MTHIASFVVALLVQCVSGKVPLGMCRSASDITGRDKGTPLPSACLSLLQRSSFHSKHLGPIEMPEPEVGERVQALPGQGPQPNSTEHYSELDFGWVVGVDSGSVWVTWDRTKHTSEIAMASWPSIVRAMPSDSKSFPRTAGWDPGVLVRVQALLLQEKPPTWAVVAQQALLERAKLLKELPSGDGHPPGPWSPTNKSQPGPSGDLRDFAGISPHAWPCTTTCPEASLLTGKDVSTCSKAWRTRHSICPSCGGCALSTGKPWVFHDGYLNPDGQEDRMGLSATLDALEVLSLAWWFGSTDAERESFATTAVRVLRSWFLNEATGMHPRLDHAMAVPGASNSTASALAVFSQLANSRLPDSVAILQTAAATVWTSVDDAAWRSWASSWLQWIRTVETNQVEPCGSDATFRFIHVLAMAHAAGDVAAGAQGLATVDLLREGHLGSLAGQIAISGKQTEETAMVEGAARSRMNLNALFQMGDVASVVCRTWPCTPSWNWTWEASSKGARDRAEEPWVTIDNSTSTCRLLGRGNIASIQDCRQSCLERHGCSMVVTRQWREEGLLTNCFLKKCHRRRGRLLLPRHEGVFRSAVHIRPLEAAPGSGSLKRAVDYLMVYALGEHSFAEDHRIDRSHVLQSNDAISLRDMAPALRRAAVRFGDQKYEDKLATLETSFPGVWEKDVFNLLVPPLGVF